MFEQHQFQSLPTEYEVFMQDKCKLPLDRGVTPCEKSKPSIRVKIMIYSNIMRIISVLLGQRYIDLLGF